MKILLRRLLPALLAFCSAAAVVSAAGPLPPDGFSGEEALRLGERMYRTGVLPSGKPMMATAQGDILVDGRVFACVSCHLRSGLGAIEGTIISPPVTGRKLFAPRPRGQGVIGGDPSRMPAAYKGGDIRQAYTDESLGTAIRAGEDAAGNRLDPFMPRYLLDDRDLAVLIYYLKHLSAENSPGVDDMHITFATVTTDGVPREKRDAMIDTLRAYLSDKAVQSRRQRKRAAAAGVFMEEMDRSFRAPRLLSWELTGPPDTWRKQLEEHYAKEPVFALLGGIGPEWGPVHRFCEDYGVPCVFPMTDFPVISESDWYTLYVSKGLPQEGEAAARFISAAAEFAGGPGVVQVFREDRAGRTIAAAFRETYAKLTGSAPEEEPLSPDVAITPAFRDHLASKHAAKVWVLWLSPEDLVSFGTRAADGASPRAVFLSYRLLGEQAAVPEPLRDSAYLTYPYRLPKDRAKQELVVRQWLKIKNIPLQDMQIQAIMYDLGVLMTDTLMMMQSDFVRDYFLDVIDMMRDHTYTIAPFPRLSFGPGQRYASKGCYIVKISPEDHRALLPVSDWVVY